MPLIKINTYDPNARPPKMIEYQISPETLKAVIATVDCHMLATKPIALSKQSQQSFSFFRKSTTMISAYHLPSHIRPGDELEINDLVTQDKYKVKFSEEYMDLCRYYRIHSHTEQLNMALSSLGAKEKYSAKRSEIFRAICYAYCPLPQDMGEEYFKHYLVTLEKIIKQGDNEEKAAIAGKAVPPAPAVPAAEKAVPATKSKAIDLVALGGAGTDKKPQYIPEATFFNVNDKTNNKQPTQEHAAIAEPK